jgi:hypothetical protein
MTWKLSRFRAGDIVEVCSQEEILATLDKQGCFEEMPFMPEMFHFCGNQFRVSAVAHKACDMVGKRGTSRRLETTVHLDGLRCDGTAHGGCQAECNLFWKDVWLKRVGGNGSGPVKPVAAKNLSIAGCAGVDLLPNAYSSSHVDRDDTRYFCQATEIYRATKTLKWWDARQYVLDVVSGNHSAGRVLRVLFLASLRSLLAHIPIGFRLFKSFSDWVHERLTGRPSPSLCGKIRDGVPTPTARLDLKPGEYVRIKAQSEIEQTINKKGKNRGLSFDPEEMALYCGGFYKVRSRVSKIIDETTGTMLHMKEPCIMLDGVVCKAEYASCRLNCPRAIPSYWRELWLERVETDQRSNSGSKR